MTVIPALPHAGTHNGTRAVMALFVASVVEAVDRAAGRTKALRCTATLLSWSKRGETRLNPGRLSGRVDPWSSKSRVAH